MANDQCQLIMSVVILMLFHMYQLTMSVRVSVLSTLLVVISMLFDQRQTYHSTKRLILLADVGCEFTWSADIVGKITADTVSR